MGVTGLKKPIFGCGWKMYFTDNEAIKHALAIKEKIKEEKEVELYILPSFSVLRELKNILEGTGINVGAQNMCWEERGAFTGEVSVLSLKEIGIKYIEIGHSERREFFGETNETVNRKLKKALEHGLIPVFCFGEKAKEKEMGLTEEVLIKEIRTALKDITYEDATNIIYAYEPIWAIGKKDSAHENYVEQIHRFIRELLKKIYVEARDGKEFKVIYGGSVSLKNISKLIQQPNIDGVFVGRASLKPNYYLEILKTIKKQYFC